MRIEKTEALGMQRSHILPCFIDAAISYAEGPKGDSAKLAQGLIQLAGPKSTLSLPKTSPASSQLVGSSHLYHRDVQKLEGNPSNP